MSTINVRHSHGWPRSKILPYFSNAKLFLKKLYPSIWRPVKKLYPSIYSSKACGLGHNMELNLTGSLAIPTRMVSFWVFVSKKIDVSGVSVRHRGRCYRLISLRKSSLSCTILRVYYSSLNRWRITIGTVMLTLNVIVSFSPCFTKCSLPETLPVATLKVICIRNNVTYPPTASTWSEQRRKKLCHVI
jgi:hypothetical protein